MMVFMNLLVALSPFGANVGVVRYLSVYNAKDMKGEISKVIFTSSFSVMLFFMFFSMIIIVLSKWLAGRVLGNDEFRNYIIICALGLPFVAGVGLLRSFVQGLKAIRIYAFMGIVSSWVGLLLVVPLVILFNLGGAVYHILIFSVVNLVIAYMFYRRLKKMYALGTWNYSLLDRSILGELVKFGLASLVNGAANSLGIFLVRGWIIAYLGAFQNGLYQAVYGISNQFFTLTIGALLVYTLPRLSELGSGEEVTTELNRILKLVFMLMTPTICVILLFKYQLIWALYSRRFQEAAPLFELQMAGDFFKAIAWPLGVSFLALKFLRAFMFLGILWGALFAGISLLGIHHWNIQGVMFGYFASMALLTFFVYFFLKREINFRLERGALGHFCLSAALVGHVMLYPARTPLFFALLGLLSIIFFLNARRDEEVLEMGQAFWSRIKGGIRWAV